MAKDYIEREYNVPCLAEELELAAQELEFQIDWDNKIWQLHDEDGLSERKTWYFKQYLQDNHEELERSYEIYTDALDAGEEYPGYDEYCLDLFKTNMDEIISDYNNNSGYSDDDYPCRPTEFSDYHPNLKR